MDVGGVISDLLTEYRASQWNRYKYFEFREGTMSEVVCTVMRC